MTHATDGSRRIGALARETGLSIRTLRYYDRLGLLTPSARAEGGHRCYDADDSGVCTPSWRCAVSGFRRPGSARCWTPSRTTIRRS